ncbi:hypothetical protein EW145_g2722 [Phellinidium pouzarii]|uniref:Phosphatidic acid phosphatase type 2/haloperoxidase domain-containing protein n=1 Tax=Phellinidium pouzarii TaxID=167371 RepID=A0A4S4LA11_9AGAM|nr:hypothetical protein EW145_g2722 [Phellinidium pouzarii]
MTTTNDRVANGFHDTHNLNVDKHWAHDTNSIPNAFVNTDALSSVRSDAVGTAAEEFYTRTLAPWRAAARRFVMRNLRTESEWIARLQKCVRSPWWDSYFVYTSSLGTHTFFMTALPIFFFFGFPEAGRGLVFVLGMGVYASSFLKDVVCAPRPYAPPVTRLTIGSHHLEYGFPSTHSTNSVSIALYIYSLIHVQYFSVAAISTMTYSLLCVLISVYIFSIVFGRLYTGMHSLTDCAVGVALGTAIWGAHALWWSPIEAWIVGTSGSYSWLPSWGGPLVIALLCGLMVHRHPQPVDDCPCFEDAIAFVSVIAGVLVSHWGGVYLGFEDHHIVSRMAGRALPFMEPAVWENGEAWAAAWRSMSIWWGMALLKLTLGISIIFAWRLIVKVVLHSFLPPLFRMISYKILPRLVSINILPKGSELPVRRFYTPATEYDGSVPEGGLHPIPSVIDLPATLHDRGQFELDSESGGMKKRKGPSRGTSDFSWEKDEKNGYLAPVGAPGSIYGGKSSVEEDDKEYVKHYDADVLTKVIVYAGIGILATGPVPVMFEILGWGVHP